MSPKKRVRPRGRKPGELTAMQQQFVVEFLANGGNATRAYLASHPNCKSTAAAAVEGNRVLRTPHIQKKIELEQERRWKRLEMKGDEAIALISISARADIRDIHDPDTGAILPVKDWPDSVRLAVKGIKANGDIILHDGLKARELLAQAAGRIKNTLNVNHNFDHAAYLADEPEGEE